MKLVVIVLTLVMTVFTARAPEEVHTEEGPHQRETPEQLEAARLKKNQDEAEMLARVKLEVRARKAAALAAKNNGKGGVTFADDEGGILIQGSSNPASTVTGEADPDTTSQEELETIKALEPKTLSFSERENKKPPLSNLESVESELKRNLDTQKEIEDLLKKTPNDRKIYKEKLNEKLDKLEEQQKILINSQEFLAFCKDKTPPVTFTGSELENIFMQLKLPSLSDKSLEDMSSDELKNIKKTLTSIIYRINNAKDMPETRREDIDILIKKYQNNSSINFLNNYLEDRKEKAGKIRSLKINDSKNYDVVKQLTKDFIEQRKITINNSVSELKVLLNYQPLDQIAINDKINDIKFLIGRFNEKFDTNPKFKLREEFKEESVTLDAKNDYQQLLVLANKAGTLINGIDVALKVIESDFVFNAENLSGLADMITALRESSPEIQAKFNAKVLEGIEKSDFVFKPENLSGLADMITALRESSPEIQAKFNAKVLEGIEKSDFVFKPENLSGLADMITALRESSPEIQAKFNAKVLKAIEKSDFVFNAENLSGLADMITALRESSPEIQAKFNAKVLEGINNKQISLTSEQKQFVKTIIKQTETFSNLKAQADKAIAEGDVASMKKLQDEMRDFYENVFRNSWKDKDLETINSHFTQTMRSSINDTLKQFTKTINSIDLNHAKNKPSLLDNLKYKLKRLVVRAKNFPKIIYRSEDPANKDNFGLGLVDFKKAADDQKVERNKVIEFLKNPSDYLKGKLTDLGNQLKALAKPVQNINTSLTELNKSLGKISKEEANKQLALIEKSFKSLKGKESEFEENRALICDTFGQLAGNKPLNFETGENRTLLTNEEVKRFIADSLGINVSEIFSTPREKLSEILAKKTEASLAAGEGKVNLKLRDLAIPLKNDLLWAVELLKLKENPVVISDKDKQSLMDQMTGFDNLRADFDLENKVKDIINKMPNKK